LKDTLVDYFSRTAKSAAVAVYSAPERLNEANKRLGRKTCFWKIFLNLRLSSKKYQEVAYFLNKKRRLKKSLNRRRH